MKELLTGYNFTGTHVPLVIAFWYEFKVLLVVCISSTHPSVSKARFVTKKSRPKTFMTNTEIRITNYNTNTFVTMCNQRNGLTSILISWMAKSQKNMVET